MNAFKQCIYEISSVGSTLGTSNPASWVLIFRAHRWKQLRSITTKLSPQEQATIKLPTKLWISWWWRYNKARNSNYYQEGEQCGLELGLL